MSFPRSRSMFVVERACPPGAGHATRATVTPTDVPNVDLHGGTDPNVNLPNYVVNFNDIGLMVQAFAGWPYPYSDPGDCPDVASW